MIPDFETIQNLHQKYASFAEAPGLYELVFEHCQIVGEIALWCAGNVEEPVDRGVLHVAALLHDVGAYPFFDQDGKTDGYGFYPMHAFLGAKLVLDEGFDPRIAQVIGTHLVLGISKEEILSRTGRQWPLPVHDYRPTSIEGELLGYADRFHTKTPQFNDPQKYLARMRERTPAQAPKFEAMIQRFGMPDLSTLAQKYNQNIR